MTTYRYSCVGCGHIWEETQSPPYEPDVGPCPACDFLYMTRIERTKPGEPVRKYDWEKTYKDLTA